MAFLTASLSRGQVQSHCRPLGPAGTGIRGTHVGPWRKLSVPLLPNPAAGADFLAQTSSNFRLTGLPTVPWPSSYPAQLLPLQFSAPGVHPLPCLSSKWDGIVAVLIGFYQQPQAFTFEKHPSELHSFKLNMILNYFCSFKGMPGTFAFT